MLIIALSILIMIGFAALLHAVNHAAAGYENSSGFHPGAEPPQLKPLAVPQALAAHPESAPPTEPTQGPPKRPAKRATRKIKGEQIMAAFQLELDASFRGQSVTSADKSVSAH